MKIACLILDNNCFAYTNKCYNQVRDGAVDSVFIQMVPNIYMFDRKHDLIQYQEMDNVIY